ncbi:MAG: hypothetical protein AB7D27_12580 [Desulfomicrobium sp.]
MDETAQSDDRRQQRDRRRVSGRRETDQHLEEAFQQAQNNAYRGRKTRNAKPVTHALSEDEIRFLLCDD